MLNFGRHSTMPVVGCLPRAEQSVYHVRGRVSTTPVVDTLPKFNISKNILENPVKPSLYGVFVCLKIIELE